MNAFQTPLSIVAGMLICGGLLSACSSEDLGDQDPIAIRVDPSAPTWDGGVRKLLEAKCDNCHSTQASQFVPGDITGNAARYQWGLSLSSESFAPLALASYGRLFERESDPMPPLYGTPLDANEKAALKKYIDDTAVAEACASHSPNTLTWGVEVSSVFAARCAACHSSATGVGKLDLSTRENWKAHRVSVMNTLVTARTALVMPPGRPADFLELGKDGYTLLQYVCASAEMTGN